MKPGDIVRMKSGGTSMLESDSYNDKNKRNGAYILNKQLGVILEVSDNPPPRGCCRFVKVLAAGSGWIPEHFLESIR